MTKVLSKSELAFDRAISYTKDFQRELKILHVEIEEYGDDPEKDNVYELNIQDLDELNVKVLDAVFALSRSKKRALLNLIK